MTVADIPVLSGQKKKLRRAFIALRRDFSVRCGTFADGEIKNRIISSDFYAKAEKILLYYPLDYEINLLSLIDEFKADGKIFAFPRCGPNHSLTFHCVNDPNKMSPGSFGIPEPPASAPVCDTSHALCMVPALACDLSFNRLGYGGGYYDRFLENFDGLTICPVYSPCISSSALPHEETDIPVDIIITEKQIFCRHY